MMSKTIFLVLFLAITCHSYTIKSKQKHIHFPVQIDFPHQRRSFQRFYKNQVEILDCPDGYVFGTKKMTCELESFVTELDYFQDSCPLNFRGEVPDPFNCRNFISCYDGFAYLQPCTADLLFSNSTMRCEWPEESQCCEYLENTASKYGSLSKMI